MNCNVILVASPAAISLLLSCLPVHYLIRPILIAT